MAKSRDEMTRKAMEAGMDVPAGMQEAAGLPVGLKELEEVTSGPTGFYRVKIIPTTRQPDPGEPDHVVKAQDQPNAWATFCKEMGVIDTDRTVNRVEITSASQDEWRAAQAKRYRVDLRDNPDWQPPEE